jgi:hypothetical protein
VWLNNTCYPNKLFPQEFLADASFLLQKMQNGKKLKWSKDRKKTTLPWKKIQGLKS